MQTWVEGTVVETIRWNDELYSVRIDGPVQGFEAGQFTKIGLDIGGERVGRAYSYVNAPHERPIEIHFNTVPEGPLSPRLATMQTGDRVWVTASPSLDRTSWSIVRASRTWNAPIRVRRSSRRYAPHPSRSPMSCTSVRHVRPFRTGHREAHERELDPRRND